MNDKKAIAHVILGVLTILGYIRVPRLMDNPLAPVDWVLKRVTLLRVIDVSQEEANEIARNFYKHNPGFHGRGHQAELLVMFKPYGDILFPKMESSSSDDE